MANVDCLLHNTVPTLLPSTGWFEDLPSPGAHDLLGVPRFSVPLLARTVSLLAQKVGERVLFERECLVLELEQAWPSRISRCHCPDRQRYGAELHRLACLCLLGKDTAYQALQILQHAATSNM